MHGLFLTSSTSSARFNGFEASGPVETVSSRSGKAASVRFEDIVRDRGSVQ